MPWTDPTRYHSDHTHFQMAARSARNFGKQQAMTALAIQNLYAALRKNIEEAEKRNSPETFWSPEAPIAWRCWKLDGNPKTILVGANGGWWRKRTFDAVHGRSTGVPAVQHTAPHWDCYCGINAAKDLGYLLNGYGNFDVFGLVSLTGRVHEYEHGYRAERATIEELHVEQGHVPEQTAKILMDHYGVPLSVHPPRTFSGRQRVWSGGSGGSGVTGTLTISGSGGSGGSGTFWVSPVNQTTNTVTVSHANAGQSVSIDVAAEHLDLNAIKAMFKKLMGTGGA